MTRRQGTPRARNSLLLLDTRWPDDATISVDIQVQYGHETYSPKYLMRLFKDCAASWTRGTNLKLDFASKATRKDIRVGIVIEDNGRSYAVEGWSALGTDASNPTDYPGYSMELKLGFRASFVDIRRTMLHEFGHALGLEHEHTHPNLGWTWNERAVYRYHGVYMAGLTEEERNRRRKHVDDNILLQYNNDGECVLGIRECDRASVMMYKTESSWIAEGTGVDQENDRLSLGDVTGIRKHYPPRSISPKITLARKSSSVRHPHPAAEHKRRQTSKRRVKSTPTKRRLQSTRMRPDSVSGMRLYEDHIKCLRSDCAPARAQCDECYLVSREYVDAHYVSSNDEEANSVSRVGRVRPVWERRLEGYAVRGVPQSQEQENSLDESDESEMSAD